MIRHNILADERARQQFIEGVRRLKAEPMNGFGTYDYFPWWHHRAMNTMTPGPPNPNPFGRNAAHSGPSFGPWHRYLLLIFEFQMRRVLGDDDFRLPYWDWGSETVDPRQSALWDPDVMGDSVGVVNTGPFRAGEFAVRITQDGNSDALMVVDEPLRRNIGILVGSAPSNATVRGEIAANASYSTFPWNNSPQTSGLRRGLEISLHNRIHRLVGGDMMTSTSPNDPVFWLHHSNVDRIWSAWQAFHGAPYVPGAGAPVELRMHRRGDRLHSFLAQAVTPEMVEDHSQYYQYDTVLNISP